MQDQIMQKSLPLRALFPIKYYVSRYISCIAFQIDCLVYNRRLKIISGGASIKFPQRAITESDALRMKPLIDQFPRGSQWKQQGC